MKFSVLIASAIFSTSLISCSAVTTDSAVRGAMQANPSGVVGYFVLPLNGAEFPYKFQLSDVNLKQGKAQFSSELVESFVDTSGKTQSLNNEMKSKQVEAQKKEGLRITGDEPFAVSVSQNGKTYKFSASGYMLKDLRKGGPQEAYPDLVIEISNGAVKSLKYMGLTTKVGQAKVELGLESKESRPKGPVRDEDGKLQKEADKLASAGAAAGAAVASAAADGFHQAMGSEAVAGGACYARCGRMSDFLECKQVASKAECKASTFKSSGSSFDCSASFLSVQFDYEDKKSCVDGAYTQQGGDSHDSGMFDNVDVDGAMGRGFALEK